MTLVQPAGELTDGTSRREDCPISLTVDQSNALKDARITKVVILFNGEHVCDFSQYPGFNTGHPQ